MPDNSSNARFERIEAYLERHAAAIAAHDAAIQRIDERLDRLAERHEGLANAVELLTSMHRENEERFATLARIAIEHERRLDRLESQ